jgi:3-oxoacyl-[acyl-carrier protein] reductase
MSDRYQSFTSSPLGKILVKNLGLPNPVELDRWKPGAPTVDGRVAVGGDGRLTAALDSALSGLGVDAVRDAQPADKNGEKYKALVFDATGLKDISSLVEMQEFFTPLLRSLKNCARVVVLGTNPVQTESTSERIAQRALEGFTRSLGKEIGKGSTVNLVYVAPGAETTLESTLAFFLSPKSAYVSGQVARLGATGTKKAVAVADREKPLDGKIALVTGASRGIGEQIARVLRRDGATIVGLDVPQAASELQGVMKELDGDWITLDITAPDAPQRIAQHLLTKHDGVDLVIHNAGVTMDKKLANQTPERFGKVLQINIAAPEKITAELLDQGVIHANGRIVGVASIAGIAGNLGQTSYASSKAGVIGFVDSLAGSLKDGITINAVAPGFIITQMTAAIPFATREVGQRLNALAQGGLPVDVAETIAWYCSPGSTAVNGNVVRVCGQMMLGA